jgi:hypothetical protein
MVEQSRIENKVRVVWERATHYELYIGEPGLDRLYRNLNLLFGECRNLADVGVEDR